MVSFRNISVDTLHEGDTEDNDDNRNKKIIINAILMYVISLSSVLDIVHCLGTSYTATY
jgi:hypothetical protein